MTTAPNGSRLIFRIILHRHSPEEFHARRTRRFEYLYTTAEARDRYRDEFGASCPGIHRYNDIAGFAEVYWDAATRILVDYYFRGLKNTRFGKAVAAHWGEGVRGAGFYPIPYIEMGSIPHEECSEAIKRQAISDALVELARRTAEDFGCFAEINNEKHLLELLDVDRLFMKQDDDKLSDSTAAAPFLEPPNHERSNQS